MQPLIRLLIPVINLFLLVAIIAQSGCSSTRIAPGREATSVKMVPYEAYWNLFRNQPNQTLSLDDNTFIVLRPVESKKYSIERYNSELSLIWTRPIAHQEDETKPQIFLWNNELRVLFQGELSDSTWGVTAYRYGLNSGEVLSTREVLFETKNEPENDFEYRLSQGKNRLLIAVRTSGLVDDLETATYELSILDQDLHTVQQRAVEWKDAFLEEKVYADFHIDNQGNVSFPYIHWSNGEEAPHLRLLILPPHAPEVVAFDQPLLRPDQENSDTTPTQVLIYQNSADTLSLYIPMSDDDELQSILRFTWDHRNHTHHVHELIAITEDFALKLADEESLDDYQISDVLINDRNQTTLLLQSTSNSSHSSLDYRYAGTTTKWGPILVIAFNRQDSLVFSSFIDRDEVWKDPGEFANFEGSYAIHPANGTVQILTREYEHDGIVLRHIDLTNGSVTPPRTIVELGGGSYFARVLPIWLPNGKIILWAKEGIFGDDWQMIRITP